jgi:FkbM family methyltransferase
MSHWISSAGKLAELLGRDSAIVRLVRPWYDTVLDLTSGGHGIPWMINGVTYRVVPRHRYQMASAYDPHLAEWLITRVRPNQSMLDVGANVGVYVLQFAHWSRPDGRVVAVEPNPSAREVLEKHVRLNGLERRVEIVAAAVGAAAGEAALFAIDADGMSRLGAPNPMLAGRATAITVPVVSLDDLCESRALAPDWLFLDIEGFEIAALSGARRLLATGRQSIGIVVEMHPDLWELAGTSRADAESLLRELGLRAEPLSGQVDPLAVHGHVWLRPNDPARS